MTKLERIRNYFIRTNTDDNTTVEYPANEARYRLSEDSYFLTSINDASIGQYFKFADLLDGDGNAWTDQATLNDWLRINTGAEIPNNFALSVSSGALDGTSHINKFGSNTDVDTGTVPEDIWDGGGLYVPPTQARIHNIVSASVNDTSAGSGAREIKIYGLDSNWDEISETITMNGTTNVTSVNSYIRLFRMHLTSAGSSKFNEGNITATAVTDATVSAQITLNQGQTLMAVYTVPNNKTGYIVSYYSSIRRNNASAAQIDISLKVTPGADNSDAPLLTKHANGLAIDGQNPTKHDFRVPIKVEEKSDIVLRVEGVSDSNTGIDGGFEILLRDN